MKIRTIVTIFIIFSFLTMGISAASEASEKEQLNKAIEKTKHYRNWRVLERSESANFENGNTFFLCKIISKDRIYIKDINSGKQRTTTYNKLDNDGYEYHVFSYKKEFYDNSGELYNNLKEYIDTEIGPIDENYERGHTSEKTKKQLDHLKKCHAKKDKKDTSKKTDKDKKSKEVKKKDNSKTDKKQYTENKTEYNNTKYENKNKCYKK